MFQIGDNIIYPMHGAGVIEAIEEKEIQGKRQEYYLITIPISSMQVMIPLAKVTSSSIRAVSDKLAMKNVLHIFHYGESDTSLSWKERYKLNSEKLKSGKLQEGAEVLRDLTRIQNQKALNSSEKQMLLTARKMLISELGLINGITENQATDLLSTSKNV
ncbi:CarD family transcriptional regulator [Peribacillus cavernae]|nr:CarD family transcriptional regulator [Peribacillus cavernae]MDQ0219128.1 CarD family transcriptional regulator [Peribacillus cavernae]